MKRSVVRIRDQAFVSYYLFYCSYFVFAVVVVTSLAVHHNILHFDEAATLLVNALFRFISHHPQSCCLSITPKLYFNRVRAKNSWFCFLFFVYVRGGKRFCFFRFCSIAPCARPFKISVGLKVRVKTRKKSNRAPTIVGIAKESFGIHMMLVHSNKDF